MRKIRVYVCYPWTGVPNDEREFEVEDDATNTEINEMANDAIDDMIWNRIDCGWEEIE